MGTMDFIVIHPSLSPDDQRGSIQWRAILLVNDKAMGGTMTSMTFKRSFNGRREQRTSQHQLRWSPLRCFHPWSANHGPLPPPLQRFGNHTSDMQEGIGCKWNLPMTSFVDYCFGSPTTIIPRSRRKTFPQPRGLGVRWFMECCPSID